MQLRSDQNIVREGAVSERETIRPDNGPPFVKAMLRVEHEDSLPVIWWDAGRAPKLGARVRVKGTVRTFNGATEIHVRETEVKRTAPPDDPRAALAGYFLGCVEAEAASSLRLRSHNHVELAKGASPFHGDIIVPNDETTRRWFQQREMEIGETLTAGWPLVVGTDPDGTSGQTTACPLLVTDVRATRKDRGWRCKRRGNTVEINSLALELLGADRRERDALVKAIEDTPQVEEATAPSKRADAMLQSLRDGGIEGLNDLNPENLTPMSNRMGIQNTGVIMAATPGTHIRSLIGDLDELVNTPELLTTGPAAVLLSEAAPAAVPPPEPHPTIVPSTIRQDQAVHAAMENALTVVTGPPGTGKSQVIVNAVAAAVSRGETVLVASKNNRAVDVVVDRLRFTSPDVAIVRVGASNRRNEVGEYIAKVLSTEPRSVDPVMARHDWAKVAKQLQEIHLVLRDRMRANGRLTELRAKLHECLGRLPDDTLFDVDPAELDAVLAGAREALDEFGRWLGLFGRWRRHRKRLERARDVLGRLGPLLGLDRSAVEACLAAVAGSPERSLSPRRDFLPIEELADGLRNALTCRREIAEMEAHLGRLPQKHELDDRLHCLSEERVAAGRTLLDARWGKIRRDDSAARVAANECAESFGRATSTGTGFRRALKLIPAALPALPVWAVTNLSARTNLPLQSGLFDLAVIDEASQCDVASALPILVRAKRALILGDRRQLVHITSLSRSREKQIARRWGLTDERAEEFSYRDRSCFGLASTRVEASPIFLDLHFRSHPAIVGFADKHFYEGRLEWCSDAKPPDGARAIEWVRVSGTSARGPNGRSWINQAEAIAVTNQILETLPKAKGLELSIGVVTPYGAQADLIRSRLSNQVANEDMQSWKVATTHRFQGDECDIMYFSPVIDTSMPERQVRFAADPNLINVALSRARRRLVIVGDIEACLARRNVLGELAQYVARLEAGGFDSPLELELHEALLTRGIAARTGVVVAGHRLDLAVMHGDVRIDVECDGSPFHMDREGDSTRDAAIEAEGWKVMRFSGRELSRDIERCVETISVAASGAPNKA